MDRVARAPFSLARALLRSMGMGEPMKLFVGPVDAEGNVWFIRHGAPTHGTRAGNKPVATEIHVSRDVPVDATIVRELCAGRSVSVVESGPEFAVRLERIAACLGARGIAIEWRWDGRSGEAIVRIRDSRTAVEWFLHDSIELLFVETIELEKRVPARALN
jgi:hypothetical protein